MVPTIFDFSTVDVGMILTYIPGDFREAKSASVSVVAANRIICSIGGSIQTFDRSMGFVVDGGNPWGFIVNETGFEDSDQFRSGLHLLLLDAENQPGLDSRMRELIAHACQ